MDSFAFCQALGIFHNVPPVSWDSGSISRLVILVNIDVDRKFHPSIYLLTKIVYNGMGGEE